MLVDLYMNISYKGSAPSHIPVYHGHPMKGILWKIVRKDELIYFFHIRKTFESSLPWRI